MALRTTVRGEGWQREARSPAGSSRRISLVRLDPSQPFVLLCPGRLPPWFFPPSMLCAPSRGLHPARRLLRTIPFSAILCSSWGPSFIFSPKPLWAEHPEGTRELFSCIPSSLRGERYIGMWQADQRHGPGVLVTQAGVCYQGTFQGDKMAVSGGPFPGHSSWIKAKLGG